MNATMRCAAIAALGITAVVVWIVVTAVIALSLSTSAPARDLGQWGKANPAVSAWFKRQMQPDYPKSSCCGDSDAYEADIFETENGKFYAVITDTRDDAPLKRAHIDPWTRIEIPPEKLSQPTDDPNISGHGFVWIATTEWGPGVYCYRRPAMF